MQDPSLVVAVVSLLIGVIAGLRAMMGPAAVSWAAATGRLHLNGTPVAFLGPSWTLWSLTLLALAELVADQRPSTPSRTVPVSFGIRIVSGALSGAAVGASAGMLGLGAVAGMVGATIGTVGGRAFRSRLAASFGSDRPAALIEDVIAIGGALALFAIRL